MSGDFWIGARKATMNGPYNQINDAPSFDETSPMWMKNQPTAHRLDNQCVRLETSDAGFNDKACDTNNHYICFIKALPSFLGKNLIHLESNNLKKLFCF